MKFVVGRAVLAAASVALLGCAAAQEVDNIDGTHSVYSGDHYADCTGLFCFSGPNWGNNGEQWYLLQTRLAAPSSPVRRGSVAIMSTLLILFAMRHRQDNSLGITA